MNKLYKRAFNRLPERFRKPNNENLYYVLYHDGFDDIYTGLESVRDSRNIDKASGKSLDLLGANVGQFRNGEDDDFYRLLIKTRIIANLSIGDAPTINHVMSALIKEVYLGLEEVWMKKEHLFEPAAIKLHLGPISRRIPYEIIYRVKAAGVRVLIDLNYINTFYVGAGSLAGEAITILPPELKDINEDVIYRLAASFYTEHENITIGRRD
ncbi:hypothetical protein HMPREF3229_00156 [Peptoniphilus harei]|uniref:Uncharacterized protein n=1 Tax=Peptoniphilus harei TaxID=54005 RepID=A0A133PS23_9FIRM|nr:hypothetical protein [Peptoniphilus harei]KXA31628.1 hypothetical protein HMPREF3229_00156 [Peptoniphilus harei]